VKGLQSVLQHLRFRFLPGLNTLRSESAKELNPLLRPDHQSRTCAPAEMSETNGYNPDEQAEEESSGKQFLTDKPERSAGSA
jgi:hypothetical protein